MSRIKLFDRYPLHAPTDRATGCSAFLFCVLAFPLLYIVSRYNYNLFHSLADIFTIVIASTVFVVAWNSRHSIDNHYLLYAGIAFLSFAFLDLFHVLGNKNMGVFPQYGNLGPTLYIASRYVLSISLVTAPLFINRKLRVAPVFVAYSLVTLLVLLSVFYWQNFPVCFVEGVGLTTFKVVSDYIICLILLGALLLLLLNRRSFDPRVLRLLAASILLSIATGLAFTLYADPFGLMNAVGHFLQIISFYLIYLAVIETGLTKPQDILFRKLKQSEEKFRNLFNNAEVGMFSARLDGAEILDANESFLKILDRTKEEVLGKPSVIHWADPRQRDEMARRLKADGRVVDFECKILNKNGEIRHCMTSWNVYPEEGILEGSTWDITDRKRMEEELRRSRDELEAKVRERTTELERANEALRQLSSRLLSAQEEERKRVAGEIHDTLGSCLSAIKFKVEGAFQHIGETAKVATESFRTIIPVIQEGIEECRRIQMDLRPSILDDLGLLATLSWFCKRFQTIYSEIRIGQEIGIEEEEIPGAVKIVIYRVTQEAMNNIAKHSKADQARLSLRKNADRVELILEDNGRGFDPKGVLGSESTRRGLGLTSMRERVELSGGSFSINSDEGKGTVIRASWPLGGRN